AIPWRLVVVATLAAGCTRAASDEAGYANAPRVNPVVEPHGAIARDRTAVEVRRELALLLAESHIALVRGRYDDAAPEFRVSLIDRGALPAGDRRLSDSLR